MRALNHRTMTRYWGLALLLVVLSLAGCGGAGGKDGVGGANSAAQAISTNPASVPTATIERVDFFTGVNHTVGDLSAPIYVNNCTVCSFPDDQLTIMGSLSSSLSQGDEVRIYDGDSTLLGTAIVNGNANTWSFQVPKTTPDTIRKLKAVVVLSDSTVGSSSNVFSYKTTPVFRPFLNADSTISLTVDEYWNPFLYYGLFDRFAKVKYTFTDNNGNPYSGMTQHTVNYNIYGTNITTSYYVTERVNTPGVVNIKAEFFDVVTDQVIAIFKQTVNVPPILAIASVQDSRDPNKLMPINNGGFTTDTTPLLTVNVNGLLNASDPVDIYDDFTNAQGVTTTHTKLGSATLAGTYWTYQISSALPTGTHSLQAEVLNADGSSRKSDPWVILVNTTQPTITATVNPDSSLSITISGLWAQVKQVFLSFSRNLSSVSKWVSDASQPFTFVTTLAKNAVDVVQQFFKSSGDVTITYDLQNYLGYGYQKLYERTITVPINLVTQTASITSVQDNSVTPAMAIANNGNTTDNTPVLSGTVSDALAQYYTVRIYDGGTYLGTATLDASNMGWTYTSRALAAGTHYLMAVVAKADGVEGTRSSEWVITVNAPVVRMTLPNTGITPSQCYSAGNNTLVNCLSTNNLNVQQDGHRSTQNAMAYSPVPNSSGGYDCVKDNNTGLYWEFKPRTYYVTERRSVNKFYTNYDNNSDDGSNPNYKYNINADSNSVGYVNWVNSQSSLLCGYSDWRIPTVYELHTLVNYNKQNYTPHIDPVFGITNNVWGGPIWTSSPRADLAGNAWCVDFDFGYVTASCARNMPARVLLVRGP